jgi:hypothetical protein
MNVVIRLFGSVAVAAVIGVLGLPAVAGATVVHPLPTKKSMCLAYDDAALASSGAEYMYWVHQGQKHGCW